MARRNIFGEMASKLRQALTAVTQWTLNSTIDIPYSLNTQKMDYTITKELYYNTLKDYKLGAGFAKPVINTTVGFCGLPAVITSDRAAQETIDSYMEKFRSLLLIAQRNSLRDGDSYIRFLRLKNDKLLYKGEETTIQAFLISPESVKIVPDPITGEESEYIIKVHIIYTDAVDNKYDFIVIETLKRDKRTVTYSGNNVPLDLKNIEETNEWGFIPIVHFKNAAEPDELYGRSDLEVIEPFMKAYHDVFLQAMQSNKLNSNPKVKLKVENVDAFLKHNFSDAQIAAAKSTGQLKFDKDIYLLNTSEEMGFVEVTSAIGSAEMLLKFLFYCIIDASQVPEFAFGTAVASSKASVEEQLVPLEKKISIKRTELEVYYQRFVRILLAIVDKAEVKSFSTYEASFDWEDVSPADEEKAANILNLTATALTMALQSSIISQEAAVDYLAILVPSMHKFLSEDKEVMAERERILTGQAFIERLQAGLAGTVAEEEALAKEHG